MKNLLYFLLFCLGLTTAANAQGWQHLYPELTGLELIYSIVPASDGGAWLMANDDVGTVGPHQVLKIAPGGAPQGLQEQNNSLFGDAVLGLANGHLLFATFNSATGSTSLVETDGSLQIIWEKDVAGKATQLKATLDGYLIAYQTTYEFGPVVVTKTSLVGETLWQKTYNFDNMGTPMRTFYALASDSQGNFYLGGVQDFPYVPVLAKFSPAGELIFVNTYPQSDLIYGFVSLAVFQDSLIAAVSSGNTAILNAENGNLQQTISTPGAGGALTSGDNKLILQSRPGGNILLRKLEWNGNLIWQHTFDRPETLELVSPLWSLPDGGILGMARVFTGVGYTPFVFRTDADGNTFTSRLHGNIFTDRTVDCGADTTTSNLVVIAGKPGDTYYATTDPQGNYEFLLDTGTYLVRVIPPNRLWKLCQDSAFITIANNDTLQWNTGITTLGDCPWPTVEIGAPFLRRCFSSNYIVNYGNEGNVIADSAVVTLTLDSFLLLQSASLPFISLGGNVYQFSLGDLAPLAAGSFTVTVLVSCDAEPGQTHCSSVKIKIGNPCPTTALSTPIIRVTAACEGDSVAFKIKNVGGAPMGSTAEFVIIEDLIIMRQGQFQLPAQQDTIVKCPANGSTSRMYAGQAPGEPPYFATTTAIEGCNGEIQPGFWNMYPEIFSRQDVDQDCQPNVGSFDPNDKQAVPTGYDAEHYIGRGVGLDYKIRFQNTGTDTAFTVTVRDTLSPWLDAATVRPGAASHAYTWQLLGNGVLQFKFDHILLPDSTTDLAGSQGYVSFHVEQKPEVPLQTLIENRAAIFFDFNAPVLTNTTFHRVGEKFILVGTWQPQLSAVLLRAVPNPFTAETSIEVQGLTGSGLLHLQIVDIQGQMVQEMTSGNGAFQVKKGDLEPGIYLFTIMQNGQLIGRGKLVVQE